MAYQRAKPVKVPVKGDAPNTGAPGSTPAPVRTYVNPVLTERVEPTGYGMAKNLGPSSVEPGVTNKSPLAQELQRVNALGDQGDHLADIEKHGTARDSTVDLMSLQTRPYDDQQDVLTAHGNKSPNLPAGQYGTLPSKLGASARPPVRKP